MLTAVVGADEVVRVGFSLAFLSVFCMIPLRSMQLGSLRLTYRCCTMSPGNQRSKSQVNGASISLCTFVSAGFQLFNNFVSWLHIVH